MRRNARLAAWLGLAGGIVALDQGAKVVASRCLDYGVPLPVVPGFNLTLLHNTGAAFSMFADASGWQRWVFVAIAAAVSAWVIGTLRRAPATARWMPLALTLVLGGALGNCWDRVLLGYVVDYVQLCYRPYCFPAFNVADSAITLGAAMIMLDTFRSPADAQRGEGQV